MTDWLTILSIFAFLVALSWGAIHTHRRYMRNPQSKFWRCLEKVRCGMAHEDFEDSAGKEKS